MLYRFWFIALILMMGYYLCGWERFGLGWGTFLFLLILHDFLDVRYQKCVFYGYDEG